GGGIPDVSEDCGSAAAGVARLHARTPGGGGEPGDSFRPECAGTEHGERGGRPDRGAGRVPDHGGRRAAGDGRLDGGGGVHHRGGDDAGGVGGRGAPLTLRLWDWDPAVLSYLCVIWEAGGQGPR